MQSLQPRARQAFYAVAQLTQEAPEEPVTRQDVSTKMLELGLEGLENDHDQIWSTILTGSPGILADPKQMAKPWVNVLGMSGPRGPKDCVINDKFKAVMKGSWYVGLLHELAATEKC